MNKLDKFVFFSSKFKAPYVRKEEKSGSCVAVNEVKWNEIGSTLRPIEINTHTHFKRIKLFLKLIVVRLA